MTRRRVGSRVLCVVRGCVLLVRHRDPETGEEYWVLPGGGLERGETLAQAGVREVREETRLDVRIVRRLRVRVPAALDSYALFLAELLADENGAPDIAGAGED